MMDMRNRIHFALLFALLSTGCAHVTLAQEKAFSPSELNLNSTKYNGHDVVVQGYLTLEPSAHSLYESEQLKAEFGKRWDSDKEFDPKDYMKYCLTVANPQVLSENREAVAGKTIFVKGKFIDNYLDRRIDLGACPLPTAIIIDEADFKARYPQEPDQ